MKLFILTCLVTLMLGRCTETNIVSSAENATSDPLTIRTGTSFGMCVGYCQHDYVVNGTTVTLTQNGTRTQASSPTKTCQTTLTSADWDALKALVNIDSFSSQPETIGCPDCADGGAEYVELAMGDRKHRVTFSYNKTIPGSEALVDALRKRREAFPACP